MIREAELSDLLPCADAAVDLTDDASAQHLEQDHSSPRIQNLQQMFDKCHTDVNSAIMDTSRRQDKKNRQKKLSASEQLLSSRLLPYWDILNKSML